MHEAVSAVTLFWSKIQVHAGYLCQKKHEIMYLKGSSHIYWQVIKNTLKNKVTILSLIARR